MPPIPQRKPIAAAEIIDRQTRSRVFHQISGGMLTIACQIGVAIRARRVRHNRRFAAMSRGPVPDPVHATNQRRNLLAEPGKPV
ncbi:MAG: hypothetical protein ACREE4_22465 [Stellaceae bacterium]